MLIGFVAFLMAGCSNKKEQYKDVSIFRYNEPNGITSLDPAFTRNLENISAVNQLFNGLVQMDEELNVIPCISKSWKILDSGKVYRFTLRNDVLFHESELFESDLDRIVTADDFVYSFNRLVDEKLAAPGSWVFNFVKKDLKGKYSFKAISDSVLEIQLNTAFPPFLGLLTMQYCSAVPEEIVSHFGEDFRQHPIGTGPFKFKFWSESNKLVFLKNEEYFELDEAGYRLPYLDAVNVTFNKDEEVAFLKFLKGDLDYISGLNGSYKDEILNSNGVLKSKYADRIKMITVPYLNTEYLGFNLESKEIKDGTSPLKDVEVRQAINYGFNREKMLLYLRKGIGTAAQQGFIPKGLPGYHSAFEGYNYNPEKALELLKKVGYDSKNKVPEIVLNTTAQYLDLCEYMQHELKEIGISIKIEVNPSGTHNEMVAQGNMTFFRKSWIADYPDAENYLALFYGKNLAPDGPNYTRYVSEEYDRLYLNALSESNDSARVKLYMEMDKMIIKDAVIVPLFYDQVVRFVPKSLEGIGVNPMNLLSLKKVKM
jgi:peptide/nickel transport system substrate-binding protein